MLVPQTARFTHQAFIGPVFLPGSAGTHKLGFQERGGGGGGGDEDLHRAKQARTDATHN